MGKHYQNITKSANADSQQDSANNDLVKIKWYSQSVQRQIYHFYLFGQISYEIDKYADLLNTLKTAQEDDTIIIYINSFGGALDMAVQIVNSMLCSKARVVTSLDGVAYSAATFVFLAGSEYIINPHGSFMIHNYSAGLYGKGHEMRPHLDHLDKRVEDMMKTFYNKILTEEELDHVLRGGDIWMDSEDLMKRLEKASREQNEKESVIKEDKPKKTKKRSKKKATSKIR